MRPPDAFGPRSDADEDPEGPLGELRRIWVNATGDSISRDMERARALVEHVPHDRQADAMEFVVALERLSRWLRDF